MRDQFTPPQQMPMQPTLFQANQPLEVTLSAQDWNIVLAGLHELPYRMAAQVVENLRMQLNSARPSALGMSQQRSEQIG